MWGERDLRGGGGEERADLGGDVVPAEGRANNAFF